MPWAAQAMATRISSSIRPSSQLLLHILFPPVATVLLEHQGAQGQQLLQPAAAADAIHMRQVAVLGPLGQVSPALVLDVQPAVVGCCGPLPVSKCTGGTGITCMPA
jgi:hypothetical protein